MCCCRDCSLGCSSLRLTKAVILRLRRHIALLAAIPRVPASGCQYGYNRKPNSLVLSRNKSTSYNFPGELLLLETARRADIVILFSNFSWEAVLLEVYLCTNCLN